MSGYCEECGEQVYTCGDSVEELQHQLTELLERYAENEASNKAVELTLDDVPYKGSYADGVEYLKQQLSAVTAELEKLRSERDAVEPEGYKFGIWDGRRRVEVLAIDYIPQLHPVFGMEEIRSKEPLYLHPSIPDDKVLVPIEPTPMMVEIGKDTIDYGTTAIYKAMIKAAQQGE